VWDEERERERERERVSGALGVWVCVRAIAGTQVGVRAFVCVRRVN